MRPLAKETLPLASGAVEVDVLEGVEGVGVGAVVGVEAGAGDAATEGEADGEACGFDSVQPTIVSAKTATIVRRA